GIGTSGDPATSALLELKSTTGAFLPTRLTTTQKNALTATDGMVVYDSTLTKLSVRENGAWVTYGSTGAGAALSKADDTNVTLTLSGSPTVSLLAATTIT